jgi:hypothetical protein
MIALRGALLGALLGAAGDLSIDFTSEGQRILGLEGSVDDLRYANGPLLVAPLGVEEFISVQLISKKVC